MDTFYLKPADGLNVVKPDGTLLPPAGEAVQRSAFWLRRIKQGDCVIAEPPKAAKAK